MTTRPRRCLLVEDDEAIARMYGLKLEMAGWCVDHAPDAAAALQRAIADVPDVVLLDIMLPGPDGFEVLERLRADHRTRAVTVVVLSNSQGTAGRLDRARSLGAVDWLTKSATSPAELVARLDQLLSGAA